MKEKVMRVKTSIVINYLLFGFTWLCVGIFNFFDNYMVFKIISIILLIISIFGMATTLFIKKEKYDEMATVHISKAHASGFIAIIILVTVLTLIFNILAFADIKVELNFLDLYPFFFAVGEIAVGLKFLRLERNGD